MTIASPVVRGMPLLPVPCLDETLGSWLFRAAENYRMTLGEFAKGIIALEHESLPRACDFDTQPPDALMAALTKYSGYRRSELERLVVHQTGSILPLEYRDAYCPECMREDRGQGVVYFRRAWLDAWALTCEKHHCLLGRFEPIEYRDEEPPSICNLFPPRREAYRLNPSVATVKLPAIQVALGPPTLDANMLTEMLKSLSGRDLLLVMGSEAANCLVYDLSGASRLWNLVWHDWNRRPRELTELEHPLGDIKTRLWAAYLATAVWQMIYDRPVSETAELMPLLGAAYSHLNHRMNRWPLQERQRLAEALSERQL